jgi:hypothetical protein
MPHPIYGNVNWLCVVSPSAATFETVTPRTLLMEQQHQGGDGAA